jgi:hypothetical protein
MGDGAIGDLAGIEKGADGLGDVGHVGRIPGGGKNVDGPPGVALDCSCRIGRSFGRALNEHGRGRPAAGRADEPVIATPAAASPATAGDGIKPGGFFTEAPGSRPSKRR